MCSLTSRPAWLRRVLDWYIDSCGYSSRPPIETSMGELRNIYDSHRTVLPSAVPSARRFSTEPQPAFTPQNSIFDAPLDECATALLVVMQACLSDADWSLMLPVLWRRFGSTGSPIANVSC